MWPLLRQAHTQGTLETHDLPALDHGHRSMGLHRRFLAKNLQSLESGLWRALVRDHYDSLIRQWMVALVESCLMMVPPLCLYKLLSTLESTPPGHALEGQALYWMLGLVLAKMVSAGVDAW